MVAFEHKQGTDAVTHLHTRQQEIGCKNMPFDKRYDKETGYFYNFICLGIYLRLVVILQFTIL
jgi:type VI protein secretion system component Hcp